MEAGALRTDEDRGTPYLKEDNRPLGCVKVKIAFAFLTLAF